MKYKYQQDLRFVTAVKHLLELEGGYVNDPNDAGGETNLGISKRSYPHVNIKALTPESASQIYYDDYWLAYRCNEMPQGIGEFLFDSVVNHRPRTAVRFVQAAYKVATDGYIGEKTLFAIQKNNSLLAVKRHLAWCFAYRAVFYSELVDEKPTQQRFFMGWLRRIFSLQQFIDTEVLNVDIK